MHSRNGLLMLLALGMSLAAACITDRHGPPETTQKLDAQPPGPRAPTRQNSPISEALRTRQRIPANRDLLEMPAISPSIGQDDVFGNHRDDHGHHDGYDVTSSARGHAARAPADPSQLWPMPSAGTNLPLTSAGD